PRWASSVLHPSVESAAKSGRTSIWSLSTEYNHFAPGGHDGEQSLELLSYQHGHALTGRPRWKERDIAALSIEQVRKRSVIDEIGARFRRIDFAEIELVGCRDAPDLGFAPAQCNKPPVECRNVFAQDVCRITLRIERHEQRLNHRAVDAQHLH